MGASGSKSKFREVVEVLKQRDIEEDSHLWNDLWKAHVTAQDVFEIVSPDDVRALIRQRPSNMQTLFRQAIELLYQVVESPYPIYFDQALNCIRILTRVLPFLLENQQDDFVRQLCWTKTAISHNLLQRVSDVHHPAELENGAVPTEPVPEPEAEAEAEAEPSNPDEQDPLAVILVNLLFNLLFLPEFTIDDIGIEAAETRDQQELKRMLMWSPGVGSKTAATVNGPTQHDHHRMEVIRLMLATFCEPLYQTPQNYDSCASLWLEVATSVDAPYADIVFFSLVNVVLGYDPMGWGVPYGQLISSDSAQQLMEASIQALLVLLDYGHPILPPHLALEGNRQDQTLQYVAPDDTSAEGFNIFRKLLMGIERPEELNFVFRGFSRLLNNVHQSVNTYLPGSIVQVGCESELLVLLWKFLEECPKFLPYVMRSCDVNELLIPIVYLMFEGRKDPSKLGLVHICTFILLKLSGERSFGVSLNKPYQLRLPINLPLFSGNHADLLIIVLHKLVVNGLDKLSALYNCFLTIICNISPYCKSLSPVSAVKLVNLFEVFTAPRFLYAAEANHVYVSLLLEIFNNLIQYQYEGNHHLVYAIVRRKELFEKLAGLTLPAAIKAAQESGRPRSAEEQRAGPTSIVQTRAIERPIGKMDDLDETKADEQKQAGAQKQTEEPERKQDDAAAPAPAASSNASASSSSTSSRGRFVPTQEWLDSIKSELPLNTIMRLLQHLVPQLEELSQKMEGVLDERQVVDFLKQTTMVGLLPVPHPIVIRKYQPNAHTSLWFTACMWGVIFMHNQKMPLYDSRSIKLFTVTTL